MYSHLRNDGTNVPKEKKKIIKGWGCRISLKFCFSFYLQQEWESITLFIYKELTHCIFFFFWRVQKSTICPGSVQKIFSAQLIFSFIQPLRIMKRVRNPLKCLVNLSRMGREAKGEASKRWLRETGRVTDK